jgi:hypothetical protein
MSKDKDWQEPLHRFSVWMPQDMWAKVRAAVALESEQTGKSVTVAAWIRAVLEDAL